MYVPDGEDIIAYLVPECDVEEPRTFDADALMAYLDVRERVRALRAMPYPEYLKTDHWQLTRRAALARAGRTCERCGEQKNLHVHHLTYVRRGAEDDADLMVLCRRCHFDIHHADGTHPTENE